MKDACGIHIDIDPVLDLDFHLVNAEHTPPRPEEALAMIHAPPTEN